LIERPSLDDADARADWKSETRQLAEACWGCFIGTALAPWPSLLSVLIWSLAAGPARKTQALRGAVSPVAAAVDSDPGHPQWRPQCQGSGAPRQVPWPGIRRGTELGAAQCALLSISSRKICRRVFFA